MKFRPCIDIHNGKVKQIVGGSLRDEGNQANTNFTSELDAAWYAGLYQKDRLKGGHIILLNPEGSEYYEETKRQARAYYDHYLAEALRRATEEAYGLLVLDEICAAYRAEMINRKRLLAFLEQRPQNLEVVLTGRDPAEELLAYADYVSEVRKIKHPFERGITAREGIEY